MNKKRTIPDYENIITNSGDQEWEINSVDLVYLLLRRIIEPKIIFDYMKQEIAQIAIVVDDYDEAIAFYTQKLNFALIEDTKLSESKRWVKVKPVGPGSCSLLLAKANGDEQRTRVGNQTGGRVFLFLHTDDFDRDYQNLLRNKVTIIREPLVESWGKVAVFQDLYGNLWDLIQPVIFSAPPSAD